MTSAASAPAPASRPRARPGAAIGRPKLAESTRLAIANLAAAGTAKTEIARTLGVSRSSVYRALGEEE
ncbi:hypothetical protein TPAU25S_04155 [Tsukamurella paurometabola]|uniref:helix-turn-helix domain-containing protein n=1 Tax=Tsukamurella paurometabola TaxID=2061 RepID=UPI0003071F49|nr:Helix-turn-helix domain of resolvase [Tsukamurella paurometabola]